MAVFDKKLMMDNIAALRDRNNVRTIELESAAGVSAGYFSRLAGKDNVAPSVEVVCAVADRLGVSVDDLLSVDFSKLNPTQEYLLSFMNKLISDTKSDSVIWKTETADEMNSLESNYNGDIMHPLFKKATFTDWRSGQPESITRSCFKSMGYGVNTRFVGNTYSLRLKNGVTVYVVQPGMKDYTSNSHDVDDIELWLYSPEAGLQGICVSIGQQPFSAKLVTLLQEIEKAEYRPKIRKELRYSIDAFMKNDLEDDPVSEPELPF